MAFRRPSNPNPYPFANQPGQPAQPASPADDQPNSNAAGATPTSRKRARAASDVGDGAPAGGGTSPRSHSSLFPSHQPFLDPFHHENGSDASDGSDDGGGGKPDKKAGRRKIKIEFIQDKSRRHITFSKRKAGIMKKVTPLPLFGSPLFPYPVPTLPISFVREALFFPNRARSFHLSGHHANRSSPIRHMSSPLSLVLRSSSSSSQRPASSTLLPPPSSNPSSPSPKAKILSRRASMRPTVPCPPPFPSAPLSVAALPAAALAQVALAWVVVPRGQDATSQAV